MRTIILGLTVLLTITSCVDKKTFDKESKNKMDVQLTEFKSKFSPILTSHFPTEVENPESYITYNTNKKKNDFSIYLIEYNVSNAKLDEAVKSVGLQNVQATYSTKDSCILKVNRLETVKTFENNEMIKVSNTIEKNCYKDKLPVPNFIDYVTNSKLDFWSDPDFLVYVLEAKSGNNLNAERLLPNPQMPNEWKNGFSRGIAINRKRNVVVYWGIQW